MTMNSCFKVLFLVLYISTSLYSMEPLPSSESDDALRELIDDHYKWMKMIDERSEKDPNQWLKYHLVKDKITTSFLNTVKDTFGNDALQHEYIATTTTEMRLLHDIIFTIDLDDSLFVEVDQCITDLERELVASAHSNKRSHAVELKAQALPRNSNSLLPSSEGQAQEDEKQEHFEDPSPALDLSKEEIILKRVSDMIACAYANSNRPAELVHSTYKNIKHQLMLSRIPDETMVENVFSLFWKEASLKRNDPQPGQRPLRFDLHIAAMLHHNAFKKWIKVQADGANDMSNYSAQRALEDLATYSRQKNGEFKDSIVRKLTPDGSLKLTTLDIFDGPVYLQEISRCEWKSMYRILDHFPHAAESKYAFTAQKVVVFDDTKQDINDRQSICIDSSGQTDTIYRAAIDKDNNNSISIRVEKQGDNSWIKRFALPEQSDAEYVIHSMSAVRENTLNFSPKKTLVLAFGKKHNCDKSYRAYISTDGEYKYISSAVPHAGLIGRKLIPGTDRTIRFYDWMKDTKQ